VVVSPIDAAVWTTHMADPSRAWWELVGRGTAVVPGSWKLECQLQMAVVGFFGAWAMMKLA
jgi:hypothetical protein